MALTSAQKLQCRRTIFAERLPMLASALKHDLDIIIQLTPDNWNLQGTEEYGST